MKTILSLLLIIPLLFNFDGRIKNSDLQVKKFPVYDHIVIVVEENKDYDQVIGNKSAPYINNVLVKEGANLTQMYAEEHYSEGNYFWLFSGSNQNVGFYDVIPNSSNNKKYPFNSGNMAEELIAKGLTFKGYSESLPDIGDTVSFTGHYARKHVPWISFSNIPNGKTTANSVNLQFKQFPDNFNKLPTVAIIVPNLIHDMHNGTPPKNIEEGDRWLKDNLDKYYRWAKTHNSLLIITFDENDDKSEYAGLTDPASENNSIKNRIPTIFAGAHIKHGNYSEGNGMTHVNILRTIEKMYNLSRAGYQQKNALSFSIKDNYTLQDIFK